MSTIQQYYDYSQLSLTAYAIDLKVGILTNTSGFVLNKAGLTDQQITTLNTDGWQVVGQSSDAMYGASGFSATLFKNTETGEYVFANRGTETEVNDLAYADVWGIVIQGMAGSQIIDMYRFYKQLITPQGQHVVYSVNELNALIAIKSYYSNSSIADVSAIFDLTQNDLGVGLLSADQAFTTTGHSLGGHLSLWLDKLVPAVSHVYTYNGAGNGGFFQSAVTTVAGTLTGTPFSLSPDSGTTNVFGYGGPAIISGVGGNVGANIPVDIEFKDPIDSLLSGLYNHSIVQLTDAMAVVNLFNKLDAGITTERFNDLFLKGSNEIGTSLEGLLDGLRSFFGKTDPTPNNDRDQFYSNLYDLQNSTAYQTLIGKVTIAAPPTTVSEARNDFGAFLSLIYLTPFTLKANDIATAVLLETLNLTNTELALKWEQDKTLTSAQLEDGVANYSDMWLADRMHMLTQIMSRNSADSILVLGGGSNESYQDVATGQMFWTAEIGFYPGPGLPPDSKHYVFGDDNANPGIQGGTNADHLYGAGGDDILTGNQGNDYLEGNQGNDILNGGEGNDLLQGGTGFDTYVFTANYGFDIITDSDGSGRVSVDGQVLNSASQQSENIYKNGASEYMFAKVNGGNTLVISKAGDANRIIINDWSDAKNLGISLQNATPTSLTPILTGDFKKKIDDHGTPDTGDDTYVMTNGNYTADETAPDGEAGAADLITGTEDNDVIDGKGGDDALSGKAGDDYIDGGTGSDILQGGLGKDTLNGGTGDNDGIYGSSELELNKPTDVNFTQPVNSYAHPQATGFNWTNGYSSTLENGVPVSSRKKQGQSTFLYEFE